MERVNGLLAHLAAIICPMNDRGPILLARGFRCVCPNCGKRTLFSEEHYFRVEHVCRNCGLPLDRGGGFFLGPVAVNYGFVAFGVIVPIVILGAIGVLPANVALGLGVLATLGVPFALYRLAWSIWIAGFYFFQPDLMSPEVRAKWDDPEF